MKEICPECSGEGTVDSFGAFTADDLDEWYGDGMEREEFLEDYRAGRIGRAICSFCNGANVVEAEGIEAHRDLLKFRAEVAAEQRMGA